MLAGVSVILFTLMRLAPGGPEAVLIGGEFLAGGRGPGAPAAWPGPAAPRAEWELGARVGAR